MKWLAVVVATVVSAGCFSSSSGSSGVGSVEDEASRAAGRELLRRYANDDPYGTRPSAERGRDLDIIRRAHVDYESEAAGPEDRRMYGATDAPSRESSRRVDEDVREAADRYSVVELKRKMDAAYLDYQQHSRDGFKLWAQDAHEQYTLFKQALELKRRQ